MWERTHLILPTLMFNGCSKLLHLVLSRDKLVVPDQGSAYRAGLVRSPLKSFVQSGDCCRALHSPDVGRRRMMRGLRLLVMAAEVHDFLDRLQQRQALPVYDPDLRKELIISGYGVRSTRVRTHHDASSGFHSCYPATASIVGDLAKQSEHQ